MIRIEFAKEFAAVAAGDQTVPTPVLRRDLRQQTSRVALLSAMTLAAAAGLGATDARADCVVAPNSVQCLTPTATTNTQAPANAPNDRFYEGVGGQPLEVLVGAGVTVTGNGLSLLQSGGGSLNVVNNGVIGVDPGNAPSIVGDAALNLTTNGGSITYSGTGDIRNEGLGQGIDVFHNGTGAVTLDVGGKIVASGGAALTVFAGTSSIPAGDVTVRVTSVDADNGISLTNNSRVSGAVSLTATGPIRTNGHGVSAVASAGDVTINVGEVTAGSGTGVGAFRANDGVGDITISAGAVSGSRGISASNTSVGAITVDATGPVTGTVDSGVQIQADGGVNLSFGGLVTGATDGMRIFVFDTSGDDIIVTSTAGFASLNGDAVVIENEGLGDTDFNDSGPITASGGNGVTVTHAAISGDINVTTGDVTATDAGFDAINILSASTAGDVSVVVNGDLRASVEGVEVLLTRGAASGNINVTTNGSIDAENGIRASTAGSGSITVTAVGPIRATNNGIRATSGGGDVTVTAGDVTSTGANPGISAAVNSGSGGALSIDAANVTSTGGDSISAQNFGTGALSITTRGKVAGGGGVGIFARGNGAVSVAVADTVTGATEGLILEGRGPISVTGTGGFVGLDGDAVNILNEGPGTVTYDVSGPVTATNGRGIVIEDISAGEGMTVTTGAVTADGDAITLNSGSLAGDLSLVANGDVRSNGEVGIFAILTNAASTGDISITANSAVSGLFGVLGIARGSGSVNVTTTGLVTATDGGGVFAETTGGAINVTTGAVTGTDFGISAQQIGSGTGAISVTANGAVTAAQNEGILAVGNGAVSVVADGTVTGEVGVTILGGRGGAGDLSLTGVGAIVGLDGNATNIQNSGTGTVTFDVSGPITATNGNGIFIRDASGGGDINVTTGAVTATTATFNAINVVTQSRNADVNVVANGVLKGGNWGVIADINPGAATGDVSVATNAAIEAGQGIRARTFGSGNVAVLAAGPITATSGFGVQAQTAGGAIDVTTGAVTSAGVGVSAVHVGPGTGAIAITTNGAVNSTGNIGVGIDGNAGATFDGAGLVSGERGLVVLAGRSGAGDIVVTGAGGFTGRNGDAVGIQNSGAGSILFNNSGPITATNGNGINIADTTVGGDITVKTGAVTAAGTDARGINVLSNSATGNVSVATDGAVQGTQFGIVANLAANTTGSVTVTTNGPVHGDLSGIFAGSSGTGAVVVNALGPVSATNAFGITTQTASGSTTISAGDVTGPTGITASSGSGAISIHANGEVNGTVGGGIAAFGGGAIAIAAAKSVVGGRGIEVLTRSGTGNISITGDASVTGSTLDAVFIDHRSSGSTLIDLKGPITSTGGNGIFFRDTAVGGDIRVTTGAVTANSATNLNAINVFSASTTADVNIVSNGVLRGGNWGVITRLLPVDARGDMTVVTNAAIEAGQGVQALNFGSGSVDITTAGPITATTGLGVQAQTAGGAIGVTTGAVSSAGVGISAVQAGAGTGAISVVANGAVNSSGNEGVLLLGNGAINFTTAGLVSGEAGLILRAGAGGIGDTSVTGAGGFAGRTGNAVTIENGGSGSVLFNVTGPLTGTGGAGLLVRDTAVGGDIRVTTGAATAVGTAFNAIDVISASTAANVNIVSDGVLTAGNWGVFTRLLSTAATGDMTVTTNGAINARQGILATTVGTGSVGIVAAAPITATSGAGGVGVLAQTAGGAINVTTGAVTSTNNAIQATQTGAGAGRITITANGAVASATAAGIVAATGAGAGGIQIDARDAKGATSGVSTANNGLGATNILVRGVVEGATNGINAFSSGAQTVDIRNEGTVRNSSGASSAIALAASGGAVNFTNAGTLHGGVILGAGSSRFSNEGSWNSIGGDSVFTGGDDILANTANGLIVASSGADVLDRTVWAGLEAFQNSGRINLSDGGGGDVVATSANTRFLTGSVLQIDVGGPNGTDAFLTTGTLDIEAGSRLALNIIQPLDINFRYVVARADAGLTGRFILDDTLVTAFVGLSDGYTDTTAFIELVQARALAEAALTQNQRETAEGADSLADGNLLKGALLVLPDDVAAIDAFDQLSGEVHPAARRVMVDDSRLSRNAVLDRLGDGRQNGSVWAEAVIEERVTDADINAAKMERDTGGVLFGVDRALGDNLIVGVAAGRVNTDLTITDRHSTGSIQTTQGLAYIGGRLGAWGLKAGVGYAATTTETGREIAFPGFAASPDARYDGSVMQGFIDAGYRIPLQGGYLEPFASLTTIRAETDAFTETAGPAGLAVEANSDDLTVSTAGLRFATSRVGPISLSGSGGWRSMSGDLDPDGRHAFVDGATFTVLGAAQSDTAAVANVEAQWRLAPNIILGLAYDGVMGTEGQDHAVSGSFRIVF